MKKTWLDTLGRDIIEELQTEVDELILEMSHDSEIFPDSTELVCTFTAGTPANTWGAWVEIVDNTPVTPITFSSKFAAEAGHLSGALIEDISHKDKRYEVCGAYGDAKVCIFDHRFVAGEVKKLAAIQAIRVRAPQIPAGETIYYRMRCEEPLATCEISFRYHLHP